MPIGHHRIAPTDTGGDHALGAADASNGYWPHLNRLIRLHSKHVAALLPCLHGNGWHDDRRRVRSQRHDDVDELAGPETAILVRERAFDANRYMSDLSMPYTRLRGFFGDVDTLNDLLGISYSYGQKRPYFAIFSFLYLR